MKSVYFFLVIMLCSVSILLAQTGKITGKVTDARTGEALIGANVMLEGTTLGAVTNLEGYYVILSVPPGSYRLRSSIVGYTPSTISDLRVSINQTTSTDFKLFEQSVTTQEVVITATRPIVDKDVAASRANITARDVQNLPIVQVASVIGLQAGVSGLSVRGGATNQTAFVLDGITLRDERDNTPYTSVSLLAVEDIQIQTGGFSAEYGNIRSGLINVVTKEGSIKRYNVGAVIRYSPATKKYFGMKPNEFDSYWIRPFLDPTVCWTGTTNGVWDPWTQAQYKPFEGWNSVSQKLVTDDDLTNDLTPEAARQLFLWQHRKSFDITKPDYDIDLGFGGPSPVFSEELGNLRFYASFRSSNAIYAIPLSREGYNDYSTTLKVTSDIGKGMKLMVNSTFGRLEAVDPNQTGTYSRFTTAGTIGSSMNRVSYIDTRLFTTDYWAPNSRELFSVGAKFTHFLSPMTFYEVIAQRVATSYSTNPGRERDTSRIYKFGNSYYVDEAPFGFFGNPGNYSTTGLDGMRMAIGMSNARDSSKTEAYQVKFDIVSQLDKYNELKGGVEFNYTKSAVNYGSIDVVLPSGRSWSKWTTYPTRLEAYIKDKLEFEGMIVDAGVRFAMSHAGGEWYDYDVYTRYFRGAISYGLDTLLPKSPTKRVTHWMPRLNIAFPITENAKLYFNYGHFRSMPLPEQLFLIRHETASGDVIRVADPDLPLEKTVAYELGYEHNLFDMFLLRIASYYKDISDQSRLVNYIGYNNVPNYTVTTNTSYEDIRGFEFTLTKNRGNWIQGFLNYTYMVSTSGEFGRPRYYQNPVDQRIDERTNPTQFKPLAQPFARANIDFFIPYDFGPDFAGIKPLGDWRMNILASWSAGGYTTWVGGGSVPGVIYNLQYRDTYGVDLRVSKSFQIGGLNLQFFCDINNVLNLKQMTSYGFVDATDFDTYMKSLHLPEEFNKYYGNIPGDDRPMDYRKSGVEYQPMVFSKDVKSIAAPYTRPIYYDYTAQQYYRWINNAWQLADQAEVDRVLADKAYIDMPNQDWFNFLNPRDIYLGVRLSFDLF
ncbi:MAG: TonB-dependent receptor [bacterium]